MYFLVDLSIVVLVAIAIFSSIKFGFSRNFVFGILRFLIALAGGAGLVAGVYILFDKLGWIESLTGTVAKIFGDNSTLAHFIGDENVELIGKILAYLPIGIILFIVGYIFTYWFIAFLMKLIFHPIFKSREKKGGKIKIIDNVLGLIFNLAILFAAIYAFFGVVHAYNETDKYMNVAGAADVEHPSFGQEIINDITEPMLYSLNESFTASPIGYLIYNYNPLNKVFSQLINK